METRERIESILVNAPEGHEDFVQYMFDCLEAWDRNQEFIAKFPLIASENSV